MDLCLLIPFTKRFARLSAEEFIEKYIVKKINPHEIILGDDFRFGQNREGTLELLKAAGQRQGFKVCIIKVVRKDRLRISSTVIRKLIAEGKLKKASQLLGRPISFGGRVVSGESRGEKLGFPTANIHTEEGVFVPQGVYFVKVKMGKETYYGIANIGVRPSFAKKNQKAVFEVHILDFHRNIYGRPIMIEILDKLRDERQFNSTRELIAQIQMDEQKARKYLRYHSPASNP